MLRIGVDGLPRSGAGVVRALRHGQQVAFGIPEPGSALAVHVIDAVGDGGPGMSNSSSFTPRARRSACGVRKLGRSL